MKQSNQLPKILQEMQDGLKAAERNKPTIERRVYRCINPFDPQRGEMEEVVYDLVVRGFRVSGCMTRGGAEYRYIAWLNEGVWDERVERAEKKFKEKIQEVLNDPSNYDKSHVIEMKHHAKTYGLVAA